MTTINFTSTPAARALLDRLVPQSARDRGALNWEDYLNLLDRMATAHLSAVAAQRTIRKRSKRRPLPVFDDEGGLILRVSLDDRGERFALVDACDWIEMQEDGANGLWAALDNGRGRFKVRTYPPMAGKGRQHVNVGRLILGLGAARQARFRNGDPLDLRRCNLDSTGLTASPEARRARHDARSVARRGVQKRNRAVAEGRCFGGAVGAVA